MEVTPRLGLSQEAFDLLLATLDPLRERAGERYEAIRLRLLRFFLSRNSPQPEELVDETIDRVCRKLAQGELIRSEDMGLYFLGVARYIAREGWERELKRRESELSWPARVGSMSADAAEAERALACLDRCLQALPPESRDLLLRYHDNDPPEGKAEMRRALVARLGVAPNALRIRVHRLRAQLENCIRRCLESRDEPIGPSGGTSKVEARGSMSGRMSDGRCHRYLLGELPDQERDLLEEEYFATEEGFQEIRMAEDELVDAYVAGELSPDRRARFEERYLRSEDDRRRVRLAALLQEASARARGQRPAGSRPTAVRTRPLAWAAALGAAALAGGLLVQTARLREARSAREAAERSAAAQEQQARERERRLGEVQGEQERLRAEAERLADLAASASDRTRVVALVLAAGLMRGLDPVPELTLSADVAVVRLTLKLQTEGAGPYRASLQTPEGGESWARAGLRPQTAGGARVLVLSLPAARLARGHHLVVVSGEDGVPLAEYVLEVVRR